VRCREPGKGASLYRCYRKTPHVGVHCFTSTERKPSRAREEEERELWFRHCLVHALLPPPHRRAAASPARDYCRRLTHGSPPPPHPRGPRATAAAAASPTCRCRLTRMPPPLPRLMRALDEEQAPRGRGTPASARRGGSCRRHSRGGWLARTPS
jgi:hypothetical protein